MGNGQMGSWWEVKRNNIILWNGPLGTLMNKYIYT